MKRMMMIVGVVFYAAISVATESVTGSSDWFYVDTRKLGKWSQDIEWTYSEGLGDLYIEGVKALPDRVVLPDVPDIEKKGHIGSFDYEVTFAAWHPYRHSITNVVISQGVTEIGSYAFWDHRNMKSVSIPDSVHLIDYHAFASCSNLTSVSLSYWFRSLDSTAFVDCPKLERISVNETNHWFQSIDGVLYGPKKGAVSYKYQKKDVLLRCPPARYTDGRVYDVSDSAIEIGDYSFMGCSGIGGVNIPDAVWRIGEQAFDGCTGLVHIELPSSVTTVAPYAFKDCANLKSIVLPPSLGSLSSSVFMGCSALETIFMHADTQFDAASLPASVSIIRWKIIDDRILVISGRGSVPSWRKCPWSSEIDSIKSVTIGNGITNISEYAFYCCDSLTSVVIPDSVTAIGNFAFAGCCSLKSVVIGDSVTNIGSHAFAGCFLLISVTIPDSVTSIGGSAFRDCSGLTSVIIPDSVTSIGDDAFSGCSSLTQFIVDSNNPNYKSVNGLLLSKDGKILIAGVNGDVVIPDSVTSIGNYAFDGRRGLTSVTIPDSVTSIGEYAFSRCELLESVTIADIKYLAHYSFSSCDRLADVTISDGVEIIFDGAFDSCDSLTNITLASSVKDIREGTFNNCHSLRSIVFLGDCPSTPVNIFSDVSSECTAYIKHNAGFDVTSSGTWYGIKIEYLKRNIMFDAAGGIVDEAKRIVEAGLKIGDLPVPKRDEHAFCGWFDAPEGGNLITSETIVDEDLIIYAHWDLPFKWSENNGGATIIRYIGTDSNVNIPASIEGFPVTSIGDEAFSYVSSMVSVSIPESVTNIGVNAFLGCQSLERVTLSQYALDNFSSIFADLLSSIKSIVLKEGVTSISDNAFSGYRVSSEFLENITIPQSVTNISRNAFTKHRSLKNVTISQYVCTNKLSEVFSQGYSSITNVVILDGTTSIGDSTFSGCRSLMNVVVPESVTNIGARAFNNCYSLTSVTIPYGMPYIGEYTFAGCASLKEITIPDSVTSIGKYAFYDCSSVTNMEIPNGVTNIGEYAFAGARVLSDKSSLKSITLPPSIIAIGSCAFYECEALSEVHIKDVNAWTRIDFADAMANPLYYAHRIFVDGVELTEFTISASVKDVKDYVFYNCLSLTDLVIGPSVTNIGKCAFCNALSVTNLVFMGDAPNLGDSAFSIETAFVLPTSKGWGVEVPGLWNGIKLEYLPYRWRYTDNEDGFVTITGIFPEPVGKLAVPSELDGKTVSSIGKDAFRGYIHLTEIEIPESINHIGETAFCGCANLESIFFGGSAPTTGINAFAGISNTCMVIPSSVAFGWDCEIWNGLNVYQPLRVVDTSFEGGIGQPINVKLTAVGGRAPYTWKLSDNGQNLPYDIKNDEASTFDVAVGIAQNWKADDSCWSYDLPFQFSFCGKSYSKVFVSSNGTIAFDGALNDSVPSLDILKEHPAIAVMWCANMTTDVGSGDVFIVENSTSVTFRWRVGVSVGGRGRYYIRNFSATLYVDGSIRLSYNAAAGDLEGIVAISPGYDAIVQVASLRNSSSYPRIANDIIFTPNITLLADGVLMGVFAPEEGKCSVGVTDALGKSVDAVLAVSAIPVWLYRNVGDNEISITGRMPAPSGSVNIPSMVNGKTVVEIGREAFSNCKDMTSVMIPDGVGSIRDGAFKGCESLVNVEIPNSVTNMGSEVFEGCLNSLFDHESVKGASLVDGWCVGTTALHDEIELSGVRGIASSAFVGNQKISHVTVPVGLVNIATNAFDGCINLKSVWLPIEMKSFVEDNNLFSNVHTDFNIEYYSNGILPVAYTMIFDIGSQGEWIGGGDLKQKVIASRSAIPPEVAAPNGWQFIGWIPDVSLPAISNTVFEAQYVPEMFTTRTIGVSDWDRSSKYTVEVGDKFRFNYDLSLDYYWSWYYAADNGDELELVVIDKYWNIVKILTGDYVPNAGCADWVIDVVPGTYKVGWWLPEWDWMEPDCFFEMAVEEKTFPVLNNTASSEEVKKALSSAKDSALTNITDISTYYTFIGWANGVRNSWGTVGPQAVKFSPYAWLSFALNVDNLIEHKILSSDMVISSFRSKSETGNFDLEVSLDLKGRRIGTGSIDEATMKENLRKVFEVEGVSSIMRSNGTEENGFSAENVKISVAELSGGKVKLTVTPKVVGDERPNSFFFRVKMK